MAGEFSLSLFFSLPFGMGVKEKDPVLQDGGPADGCVFDDAGVWMSKWVFKELELELKLGSGEFLCHRRDGWIESG